ncbi:MAG TPA: DNA cytosine methyltransferase, partial [Gemmatimonadaceae bacterium]|nr:DNA cytosine methyltransferase [Gemmatimonadaceae bacterium]
ENVEEFRTWGPLIRVNGEWVPDPARKGETFDLLVYRLRRLGYVVEHRELRACDYGAPTIRKRLFLIARCDGQPIVWPKPTHGKGRAHPWRTAAECIDWSIPCPSIFARKKALADNTLRRIARGVRRYVIESPRPFIVSLTHHGNDRVESIDAPMMTITGAHRGEKALIAPTLIQTGYGEREGQAPRSLDLTQPLGTVVGGGVKHALVSAFLAKHYGGHETDGQELSLPLSTVTTQDHHALVTAALGAGDHREDVRAFLVAYYGNEKEGATLFDPMRTVTSKERFGLVTVDGNEYVIADIGMRMLVPRELAYAQGFPGSYILEYGIDPETGERIDMTKTAQVRMIGNSVCPDLANAIVAANYTSDAMEVAA